MNDQTISCIDLVADTGRNMTSEMARDVLERAPKRPRGDGRRERAKKNEKIVLSLYSLKDVYSDEEYKAIGHKIDETKEFSEVVFVNMRYVLFQLLEESFKGDSPLKDSFDAELMEPTPIGQDTARKTIELRTQECRNLLKKLDEWTDDDGALLDTLAAQMFFDRMEDSSLPSFRHAMVKCIICSKDKIDIMKFFQTKPQLVEKLLSWLWKACDDYHFTLAIDIIACIKYLDVKPRNLCLSGRNNPLQRLEEFSKKQNFPKRLRRALNSLVLTWKSPRQGIADISHQAVPRQVSTIPYMNSRGQPIYLTATIRGDQIRDQQDQRDLNRLLLLDEGRSRMESGHDIILPSHGNLNIGRVVGEQNSNRLFLQEGSAMQANNHSNGIRMEPNRFSDARPLSGTPVPLETIERLLGSNIYRSNELFQKNMPNSYMTGSIGNSTFSTPQFSGEPLSGHAAGSSFRLPTYNAVYGQYQERKAFQNTTEPIMTIRSKPSSYSERNRLSYLDGMRPTIPWREPEVHRCAQKTMEENVDPYVETAYPTSSVLSSDPRLARMESPHEKAATLAQMQLPRESPPQFPFVPLDPTEKLQQSRKMEASGITNPAYFI